jgi:hypothetical protein
VEYVGGINGLAGGALAIDELTERRVSGAFDERTQMLAPVARERIEVRFKWL